MQHVVQSLHLLASDAGAEQKPLLVGLADVSQAAEGAEQRGHIGPVHRLDGGERLHHQRHELVLNLLLDHQN